MRILVLGGTSEARALAAALVDRGVDVVSSLAGRVTRPRLPVGEVRIGGYGGVEGLRDYLREGALTHVVDATHPFATTMTAHAVAAGAAEGVPVIRLARPGWSEHPDASSWHWVEDYAQARTRVESLGRRPFVTTGRQTLGHFAAWRDHRVLVRVVEPPSDPLPPRWTTVVDRGPYAVEEERRLLAGHGVDVLVTKDSGGTYTAAKLTAAAHVAVPVVVVARPAAPAGLHETPTVQGTLDALGL